MGFWGWFSGAEEAAAIEAQIDAMRGIPDAAAGGFLYVDSPEGEPWTCPECGVTEEPDWCFHKCAGEKPKDGYSGPNGVLL